MTSIRMERQLLNRAEQREQVLAEAAEYLTSSWAPAEVLRQLPHLLVPGFSEWASVVLKTGPDSYVRVAAATSNEAMRQLTQERDLRLDPRTTAGIAAVIRTGHSELHATMPPEAILASKDAGIFTKGRTADFRSAVIAPLFVKGQVVGAVNASSSRAHAFSAQDLTFLERFAKLAGIAVQTGTLVEELRSRDEQLRVALDAAPIFLFSQDCDLRYTWVSDLRPGGRLEDVLGQTDEKLFPPEDAARLMAVKRHAIETRARTREELRVTFRGEQRLFDLTVEPRIGAGGAVEGITCAAYDVTELRRAEAGMRESEQRLRVATQAAELGVYEWDLRSSKAHWENERMFEILGRRESDGPLGTAAFLEIVHPDDRQELGNRMARAMKLNEQLHALVRIRRCDDNETRWVELRGAFQIDQIRVPVGLFGVMADVTDREHAAEQLRQAMNVKDEFLGLVSHELRTPMTLVLGFAQSLERRVEGADGDTRKTAHDLVVEAEWLRALIENMLVLARLDQEQPTMELFDGRQVMRHVVELHRSRFPEREIEVELGAGVLMGEGRESWVELVLQNLLSNAEKYSPSNAPITVTVGREDGYLRVAVLDRGPGLGEAEASQIFEPFYRADSARGKPGLGLGLTVCRRLITLQEGEISAAPRPGGGTEIAFRLPGAASSELHEDEPQPQQMRQGA